jgi:flagellar basal body rod protein FlgG
VIDPAFAAGLAQIAARERDVAQAYRSGFSPESSDVAVPSTMLPSTDPLSVVAPDGTYFVTPDRSGTLQFSRDGGFHVEGGELRAADGRPVLGVALEKRAALAPLRLDRFDAALGQAPDPRIDADGTLSYLRSTIDPRSGERRSERVAVGRIALARFPAGTQPERIDAVHVRAPLGILPHVGVPADGNFAALATRARDLGRLDIIAGIEKMNDAYRSFDALRSANHARGSLDRTAMELLK